MTAVGHDLDVLVETHAVFDPFLLASPNSMEGGAQFRWLPVMEKQAHLRAVEAERIDAFLQADTPISFQRGSCLAEVLAAELDTDLPVAMLILTAVSALRQVTSDHPVLHAIIAAAPLPDPFLRACLRATPAGAADIAKSVLLESEARSTFELVAELSAKLLDYFRPAVILSADIAYDGGDAKTRAAAAKARTWRNASMLKAPKNVVLIRCAATLPAIQPAYRPTLERLTA
jgi:hypothetical protein